MTATIKQDLINGFEKNFKNASIASGGARFFYAPGRVNLIGEHTDYNGGNVFPCALSLGIYAAARKRRDGLLRVASGNFPGVIASDITNLAYKAEDGWANYPKAVACQIIKVSYNIGGMDIYMWGDLPSNSGLSSSACIETLTCVIFNELFNLNIPPVTRVLLCQKAENEFVGVNCGVMDQFASGMGKEGCAILLNCQTLKYQYVPLALGEYKIVMANTNKKRGLAGSKYNERRAECESALAMLKTVHQCNTLCDLTPDEFEAHKHVITNETHRKRAQHVIYENARTLQSINVLKDGNIEKFGALLNESHASLRDLYEVTGAELDALAEASWQTDGVLGARMTGAGFGGCTVAMVRAGAVAEYNSKVGAAYKARTGLTADFYTAETGGGAGEI